MRKKPPNGAEMAACASLRNVCVVGHIDHGKSSLVDWLVAENGVIPWRLAGELRYMDSDPDEQARGITMRASAVSLIHKETLVTVVDAPGHIDFAGDVASAVATCEGALLVVDVVEGVRVQTVAALRAVSDLAPVLVLNKIDRLVKDDAFARLQRVLESVNAHAETELFSPAKGNVVFASAKHGWGFTLPQIARLLAPKLKARKDLLTDVLFGDYARVDDKIVKRTGKHRAARPLFDSLVLDAIFDDGISLLRGDQPQPLRDLVPLARAVLRAVVDVVPSPEPREDAAAYVAKVIAHDDTLLGFAKVYRKIAVGDELKVLNEDGRAGLVTVESLFAMMGRSVKPSSWLDIIRNTAR